MVLNGDARHIPLKDKSVQCVVTSPPYFGHRDYGVKEQIGAEGSPLDYIEQITLVFDEIWRVLRDNGIIWLNVGDSFAGKGKTYYKGIKQKDLIGIPWRVAFALQERGWILRSDIIWAKPNCMPESVTDRPTRSHEYLFLMAKSPNYYYNADAIKEPIKQSSWERIGRGVSDSHKMIGGAPGQKPHSINKPRFGGNKHDGYNRPTYSGKEWNPSMAGGAIGLENRKHAPNATANKRSVWTISTAKYSGSHFATFPQKLVEPCILAGAKPGDIVLDPFSGSGTTGIVCAQHGRHYIGCELNPSYAKMSVSRIKAIQPGFGFAARTAEDAAAGDVL